MEFTLSFPNIAQKGLAVPDNSNGIYYHIITRFSNNNIVIIIP